MFLIRPVVATLWVVFSFWHPGVFGVVFSFFVCPRLVCSILRLSTSFRECMLPSADSSYQYG